MYERTIVDATLRRGGSIQLKPSALMVTRAKPVTMLRIPIAIIVSIGSVAAAVTPMAGQSRVQNPIPERPFERPSGPFAVGTIDTLLVDSTRGETLSRDPADRRRVMIQMWYPTERGTGLTAHYIRRREEFGGFAGYDSLLHVRANSFDGAPLVEAPDRFPVLLYSHGGSWSRFTGTFATEWLASHGYVVIGIDHNGFNKSVLFPDGYRLVHDTLTFPTPAGDRRADALASWDYLDQQMFPRWVADAKFVLDQVEELSRTAGGRFEGRLDLDRIGMFGFSFGGAAAMEMAVGDPRIKAAVDQDGQLFGQARSLGTSRPVMLMHHREPAADTARSGQTSAREPGGNGPRLDSRFHGPVDRAGVRRDHRPDPPWPFLRLESPHVSERLPGLELDRRAQGPPDHQRVHPGVLRSTPEESTERPPERIGQRLP